MEVAYHFLQTLRFNALVTKLLRRLMSREIYIFFPGALPTLSYGANRATFGRLLHHRSPQQVTGLQLQVKSQDLHSYSITDLPLLSV